MVAMKIGELAKHSGTTVKALRFYDGIGLLPAQERTRSGYRLYGDEAVTRLRFIRAARSVGLSLEQIKEIIDLRDAGTVPCEHVLGLLESRVAEIEAHIQELSRLRTQLRDLTDRGRDLDPKDCAASRICHVVAWER